MGQLAESRIYGRLRKASPDNETTSQQDNEWGFADNGQQTTDNRIWASQGFARRLRRLVVCEATAEHSAAVAGITDLWNCGITEGFARQRDY